MQLNLIQVKFLSLIKVTPDYTFFFFFVENTKVTDFRDIIIIIIIIIICCCCCLAKIITLQKNLGISFSTTKKESSSEMSTKQHSITNNKTVITFYNVLTLE